MQIVKTTKIRSPIHRKFVREQPCCITKDDEHINMSHWLSHKCTRGERVWDVVKSRVAHHLTALKNKLKDKGTSTKTCDSNTVPLCKIHHNTLHQMGEETFWEGWDKNPELIADDLANRSPSEAIRNTLRRNDAADI